MEVPVKDYHYPYGWLPSRERRKRQIWDRVSVFLLAVLLIGLGISYAVQYKQSAVVQSRGILHHAHQIENDLHE